jgi:hypothetical protein
MPHRITLRSTLILAFITGTLICGIASAYKAGYFQSKIGATEDSFVRSTDFTDSELTPSRVRGILIAEFEGWFDLENRLISPSYISADLNGDGTSDLAAAVRLNREISPDDTTKPPFQFEKPYGLVGPNDPVPAIQMETGALRWYHDHNAAILVIIHGSRDLGLTNTKREQRFVLVDGWYHGKLRLEAYRGKLKIAHAGDESDLVPPPVLLGSALLLLNIENSGTAVYWDGTAYRWYPVRE